LLHPRLKFTCHLFTRYRPQRIVRKLVQRAEFRFFVRWQLGGGSEWSGIAPPLPHLVQHAPRITMRCT